MMKNTRCMEKRVNAIVDEILDEDQENDFDATRACPGGCEELYDTSEEAPRQCRCGVENSSRFSLRVMEAMRSLQRDVDRPSTSTAEEIADYIRSYYRYDGDLYAQVRTALRQVCSQGFVMELLSNEYHLIGPVVSSKRNGCSPNCRGRVADDASRRRRRRVNDQRNDIDGPEDLTAEPIFHSTSIQPDEENGNADRRKRKFDIQKVPMTAEAIPGPSRGFLRRPLPVLARNAKKARVEDRREPQRADENDDETEGDVHCTCDVIQEEHPRIRPTDRVRVIRNGRRRVDGEEDQRNEEDEEERVKDEEDEKEEKEEDEEDEGTEDSAYRELRHSRKTAARERELKRWIRRCRQECERRGRRGR
ncbi:hypothetical protein P5V15_005357 [Pogonomyrmex californicus]